MPDYAARLAKVQAAIESLLDGGVSQVSYDGSSVTKLDLATLQKEEQRLQALVNRSLRTGGAFRKAAPR